MNTLYSLQMFALYADLRKSGLASTTTTVISAVWFQAVRSLSSEKVKVIIIFR